MKTGIKTLFLLLFTVFSVNVSADVTVQSATTFEYGPGQEDYPLTITLKNDGRYNVYIIGAKTPIADAVILQALQEDDGSIEMLPTDRIKLPGGQTITLSDKQRLLLSNVRSTLVQGQQIDLSLSFSNGKTVTTKVTIDEQNNK